MPLLILFVQLGALLFMEIYKMEIFKLNKSRINNNGYCFDTLNRAFYFDDKDILGGTVEDDIYLPDWFEDWESPTATEMSLFELANGYKIELV